MIDVNHPFYRPLWRRIAIVAVTWLWMGFELFISKSGFWLAIAAGLAATTTWYFLIAWKDPPASEP